MFLLKLFLNPVYKFLALCGAVLAFCLMVYGKIRADAIRAKELKDLKDTQNAIRKANQARSRSNTDSDRGGLYNDDGFKRK